MLSFTFCCLTSSLFASQMLSLRLGESYDAVATDVWGCGAVLYAMLFGTPPFPATTYSELVSLASQPQVHLSLPQEIPRALQTLIRSLLRVDPKSRWTLPQAAAHPWFQTNLRSTLMRTPGFRPSDDMLPNGMSNSIPASIHSTIVQTRRPSTSFIVILLRLPVPSRRFFARLFGLSRPASKVEPS